MSRSHVIALRCAASLPKHLLAHPLKDERREQYIAIGGNRTTLTQKSPATFLGQLDACRSDEARRLLLGVSK